ncbi:MULTISPECIES: OsmC family protein [unclassified Bifidobacterium]|uniref:OsmC family protein n=1 Tax=unclassified Bifidobacterium TaxID=2608897 RepID=UPI0023F82C88|nr:MULTISPECIES: OsmC family protein [unclassified Bifidobacterium]WEV65393.1 OsmC family protein [Bifidobacterium sp. ESL0764]WEV75808.1 OsmC family protein [Bifidobacterium sp. ESL0800]
MAKKLWVERNKDGSWDAFSDEGAHLKFGHGKGQFNPGDLMKVALAACGALSSQMTIENSLGEGKGAKIVVDGDSDPNANVYTAFHEQVVVDAQSAGIHGEDVEKLKDRVEKHIEKSCTVMHTYERATPVTMEIKVLTK